MNQAPARPFRSPLPSPAPRPPLRAIPLPSRLTSAEGCGGGSTPAGEGPRLTLLAREHYSALLRFVRRLGLSEDGAEDVAQAAFMTTLLALPRIIEGCERAFLFATALRIAHSSRRRARRELLRDDLDLGPSPRPAPDDLAHRKRFREKVEALLDGVDCPSRTVFVLFELDGLTIPEIAVSMAISPQAATRRLRRTRRELREWATSRSYEPVA
jgi:RNA polymerase sigma factor (sigma-70 family)